MRRSRSAAFLALALAAAACCAAGCNRSPRFVALDADSTAHAVDSSTVALREVQEGWEAGEYESAAARTAQLLARRLSGLPPAEWGEHASRLLDSLGVGQESASGACALVLNLFARSDPLAGSWPYLITCGPKGARLQAIEGKDLHLQHVMSRGLAGVEMPGGSIGPGVAVLSSRRTGGGQQPLLMVWEQPAAGGEWKLAQTLGPDSLGGVGTGDFETPSDSTIELVTRTYRVPPLFEECATCPHYYRLHRFRWDSDGFHRTEDRDVPSTYATFVRFIQALLADDRDEAERWIADRDLWDQARHWDWNKSRGIWRVAPATDESPRRIIFFRGESEAYRVDFESRGDDWVIASFESVPRTVE